MALTANELKKEKEYLKKVLEVLKANIKTGDLSVDKQKQDIYEMKKFMWDNSSDYTDEEMMVQMHNMDHEVDLTNSKINQLMRLKRSLQSPYFGKVLFESEEFKDIMPVYIGMNSIMEDTNFYVFDWRSPISSLFYNYELGDAEYEAPMGKVKGNILNKRQFKIEDGKLIRCFDSSINIDDEFLQDVLAKQSSEKMQNIVSTIQKEQNEIIRNTADKFLIVQGIAGSGKTSVALHRIAYLLYRQKHLSSKNVLIFSPNNLFTHYISNVLPELGEQNVMTTTFHDFSKSILQSKNIESFTDYLDRVYKINNDNEKNIIKEKMSDEFKAELDSFYEKYLSSIAFDNNVSINDSIISARSLNRLLQNKWSDRNLETRLELIAKQICEALHLNQKKSAGKIQKHLAKSLNKKIDAFSIYNALLREKGLDEIKQDNVLYEDITPLLYLHFKTKDFPNYSDVKQVVIDEAQDYSKLQIEILNMLFPNASFTILGDVNQTINPNYKYNSLGDLRQIRDKSNYLELNKTYRSSEEIIDYSNKILGLNNVCAIRHDNKIPVEEFDIEEENIITEIPSILAKMEENGFKKNAIITKNKEEAIYLSKLLRNIKNLSLVKENSKGSMSGNIIIPSYMSKGLEFDGVIVYTDPDNQYTNEEKNLYYVVLSRAQHQLAVCNQEKIKIKSR